MRNAFAASLVELAEKDPRVVLLTGDLGFTVLEAFAERFPDRFFNVGVAEQNMLGISTGLADAGYIPFAYSIATFATMRPYEFVRNGAALHELPVRVVGVGGGFSYGQNGITHYALEDVGLMRIQPEVAVVAPADPAQTRAAVRATAAVDGPVYFRLSKRSAPVPGLDGAFELGRLETIGSGEDVAIVALGSMAGGASEAAVVLADRGISATVGVVSSFNPAPVDDLANLLAKVPLAVTVEDHYVVGGVGSLVAEVIAERGLGCRLVRCGVSAMPRGRVGSEEFLLAAHGLSADAVASAVVRELAFSTS